MFDKFGDYMYSLLFAPLKKTRQAVNQFYLFFKVTGKLFDDTKADIFRMREESMIASAGAAMLAEHGRDRNIPRLKGEPVEGYRLRLMMKAAIAEKAGTVEGLLLCLKSLELTGEIIPYYTIDAERWAEFLTRIWYSLDDIRPVDMGNVRNQIRAVKPASAKDNYLLVLYTEYKVKIRYENRLTIMCEFYPRYNMAYHFLEGEHFLDGSKTLSGYAVDEAVDFYPVHLKVSSFVEQDTKIGSGIELISNVHCETDSDAAVSIGSGAIHEMSGTAQLMIAAACEEDIKSSAKMTFQADIPCDTAVAAGVNISTAVNVSVGCQAGILIHSKYQVSVDLESTLIVEDHLRYLDGNGFLDGNGYLNADVYTYKL